MNIQEWREQTNGMEKETRTVHKNMLSDHLVVAHHTPPSGLAREGPHCARLRSHHVSPFCLALAVSKAGFFFDLKSGHNTAAVSWTFKVQTAVAAVALSVSLPLDISLTLNPLKRFLDEWLYPRIVGNCLAQPALAFAAVCEASVYTKSRSVSDLFLSSFLPRRYHVFHEMMRTYLSSSHPPTKAYLPPQQADAHIAPHCLE